MRAMATATISFRVDEALADELRGAVETIRSRGVHTTREAILQDGLRTALEDRRQAFNDGRPFPLVKALKAGRPKRGNA